MPIKQSPSVRHPGNNPLADSVDPATLDPFCQYLEDATHCLNPGCGKFLGVSTTYQKYCSPSCRVSAGRKRAREREKLDHGGKINSTYAALYEAMCAALDEALALLFEPLTDAQVTAIRDAQGQALRALSDQREGIPETPALDLTTGRKQPVPWDSPFHPRHGLTREQALERIRELSQVKRS